MAIRVGAVRAAPASSACCSCIHSLPTVPCSTDSGATCRSDWCCPTGSPFCCSPITSAAIASVQVWVKTGSIHEGAQLGAGLSHFLEHMLFKGTTRRAGREISLTIQAHGGLHQRLHDLRPHGLLHRSAGGAHGGGDRHAGGRRAALHAARRGGGAGAGGDPARDRHGPGRSGSPPGRDAFSPRRFASMVTAIPSSVTGRCSPP